MSGRAIEAAGDVDVLLLDKTGTITMATVWRQPSCPSATCRPKPWLMPRNWPAWPTKTPEGRSIVVLAKQQFRLRGREISELKAHFVPFSAPHAHERVRLDGRELRKGGGGSNSTVGRSQGQQRAPDLERIAADIANQGGTPLAVAEGAKVLGVVRLTDVVKGGIRERFARFRAMGVRTVMITGDNPRTAACHCQEAGVDDYLAEGHPEAKNAA